MINVSIITPTYNRGKILRATLNSIRNQTYTDIEHIIVDNLSSDNTPEIVYGYIKKAKYPVRYIRQKDNGIYQAMNKGIRAARGKWIHILNSDDRYYSKTELQELFSFNLTGFDLIACGIKFRVDKAVKYWKPKYNSKLNHYNFPHPGVITRKDFYEKVGLYDEKYAVVSDAIYASKNYPSAKYLIYNKPLVLMSGQGKSNNLTLKILYEQVVCIIFYHKFPIKYKLKLLLSLCLNYSKKFIFG